MIEPTNNNGAEPDALASSDTSVDAASAGQGKVPDLLELIKKHQLTGPQPAPTGPDARARTPAASLASDPAAKSEGPQAPTDDAGRIIIPPPSADRLQASARKNIFKQVWAKAFDRFHTTTQTELIKAYRSILGPELCARLTDGHTVEIIRDPLMTTVYAESFGDELPQPTNTEISDEDVMQLASIIARFSDQTITRDDCHIEAILPDLYARFTATIPPMSSGPMFTIRVHIATDPTLQGYVDKEMMNQQQLDAIDTIIDDGDNLLIVGDQRTGKSTLARAVLNRVQQKQHVRLGLIEDEWELILKEPNYYTLFAEPKAGRTFTDLIGPHLRYGGRSLSMGEIRSDAFSYLQAISIGNSCTSVATVHGRTIQEGYRRIELLLQMDKKQVNRDFIRQAAPRAILIAKHKGKPKIVEVGAIQDSSDRGYSVRTLA